MSNAALSCTPPLPHTHTNTHTRSKLRSRYHELQAEYYLAFSLLTKCVREWRAVVALRRQLCSHLRLAVVHASRTSTRTAWAAWRLHTQRAQHAAALNDIAQQWARCAGGWMLNKQARQQA